MKVLIIGGVAGGAGTAARLRRNDENAEIIMFEKGEYISFANCGLPYYIGDVITDKAALQLQTPESFHARFNVDVRIKNEVINVDTSAKTVHVRRVDSGEIYTESYDVLVVSPVHPLFVLRFRVLRKIKSSPCAISLILTQSRNMRKRTSLKLPQ